MRAFTAVYRILNYVHTFFWRNSIIQYFLPLGRAFSCMYNGKEIRPSGKTAKHKLQILTRGTCLNFCRLFSKTNSKIVTNHFKKLKIRVSQIVLKGMAFCFHQDICELAHCFEYVQLNHLVDFKRWANSREPQRKLSHLVKISLVT